VKKFIKTLIVKFFQKALVQADIQKTLVEIQAKRFNSIGLIDNLENPYTSIDLPKSEQGEGVVFITGRFRSGTTLLWNLFRQSDEFTAFYEPFNERQWFNPQMRGGTVDSTHRGVDDYWREFNGLDALTPLYDKNWIRNDLFMNEHSYMPSMKAFLDTIIESSPTRPILQFNRVDFRLAWLKKQYPKASIIHLYRNPRDQWCSFLTDKKRMNKDSVEQTYVDNFYLDIWCEDLYRHFPFLHSQQTPHPYKRFYYIWKLSYIFGQAHSNLSISYEDLVSNPEKVVGEILAVIRGNTSLLDKVGAIISVTSIDAWKAYAPEDWFSIKEVECERVLQSFLRK
jgi:hypothetical protein